MNENKNNTSITEHSNSRDGHPNQDLNVLTQNLRTIMFSSSQTNHPNCSTSEKSKDNQISESVFLEDQKGLLEDSSSEDDYQDFRCSDITPDGSPEKGNRLNISGVTDVEEDFRCKDVTPQNRSPEKEGCSSAVLIRNSDSHISNVEEDFHCKNVTPQNRSPEKGCILSTDITKTMLEHQKELLEDYMSSGDEDFRCSDRTPSPPPIVVPMQPAPPVYYRGDWQDECQETTEETATTESEPFAAPTTSTSNCQYKTTKDEISDQSDDESFRSTHSFRSGSGSNKLVQDNDDIELNAKKSEDIIKETAGNEDNLNSGREDALDLRTDKKDEAIKEELDEALISLSSKEKQITEMEVNEIQNLLNKVLSPLTRAKIGRASNEPQTSADLVSKASLKSYSRKELFEIGKSRTEDEWMGYLILNHGKEWAIDQMPFELDPELRCPYAKQYRVKREREEMKRRKIREMIEQRHAMNNCQQQKDIDSNGQKMGETGKVEKPAHFNGENMNTNPKRKGNKKKKGATPADGSFGAVQRRIVCPAPDPATIGQNVECKTEKPILPVPDFNAHQMVVWMEYLRCINSRINQLPIFETQYIGKKN